MQNYVKKIYRKANHKFKTREERKLIAVSCLDENILDKEFGAYLAETNISLALRFWIWAIYVLVAVRFLYGVDSLEALKQVFTSDRASYHIIYGFLLVITFCLNIICFALRKKCGKYYRVVNFCVDTYLFLFLLSSFFVSFFDLQTNMVGYSLMLSMIILGYSLYCRPMSSVFITVVVCGLIFISFFLKYNKELFDYSSMVRIVLVAIMTCSASIYRYRSKYTTFLNERNISHQKDELEKLNLELEKKKEQLQHKNKQLQYVSSTDLLTGLSNRRQFLISSDVIIEELSRDKRFLAVAVVDVDNFKQINDINGHLIGDACLVQLGKEFQKIQDDNTSCFRFGGDEFVILFKGMSKGEAFLIVDKLAKEVSKIELVGYDEMITMSVGIYSEIPKSYQRIDYFIEKADKLLYEAKKSGKNRIAY